MRTGCLKGVSQAGQPEARKLSPGGLWGISLDPTHKVSYTVGGWFPLEGSSTVPAEIDWLLGDRKPK